jgi:alpha-tubulin suppressor-like RCC1 family protein
VGRRRQVLVMAWLAMMTSLCAACDEIAGLTRPSDIVDAGKDASRIPHDSGSRDAADATLPDTAAVWVSSSSYYQDWCAVRDNGDVDCWGDNFFGMLGNGELVEAYTLTETKPQKVVGLPPATQVSVGYVHTCALTRAGGVYCWGYGGDGELGNGGTQSSAAAVPVKGLEAGISFLSVGEEKSCAVKSADGSVWCWGESLYFPSPTSSCPGSPDTCVPAQVTGLTTRATSVSVGFDAACAVLEGGGVECWGGTFEGELGDGSLESGSLTPVPVMNLTNATAVSVGYGFVCALTGGGAVDCWGYVGNIGLSPTGNLIPVGVSGLSNVSAIAAGQTDVCALEQGGKVVCLGLGGDGQLGIGPTNVSCNTGNPAPFGFSSCVPVQVKSLSGPARVISTGIAPCAVMTSGSIECWGWTGEIALSPVRAVAFGDGGTPATSVSLGGADDSSAFGCALSTQDTSAVSCWGGNPDGQLGNGTTVNSSLPACTELSATVVSSSNGGNFACAIHTGLVFCWGDNSLGQLGNGSTKPSLIPVRALIPGGATATAVSAGAASACAVAGGAAYCWGDNTYDQLGSKSVMAGSSIPVPVQGLGSGVTSVSVGLVHACAILTDGTADCWGDNSRGRLGDGTTTSRAIPMPVSGLTNVTAISAGYSSTCAVTKGAVWCWGDDMVYELGDGQPTHDPSLVPVPSDLPSGATQVAVSYGQACAIVAGDAWCWGVGANGDGKPPPPDYFPCFDTICAFNPFQVPGLADLTAIAVNYTSACAVDSTGAVFCWGSNSVGQLGNGGPTDHFVPVPVAGFP